VVIEPEPGPDIEQVVLDDLSSPRHHGGNHASFRRGPRDRFP
jgi:hypothetical protein